MYPARSFRFRILNQLPYKSLTGALDLTQPPIKVYYLYDSDHKPYGANNPDSKVRVANMGPTWVLAAPGGSHVGPMNLAIREILLNIRRGKYRLNDPVKSPYLAASPFNTFRQSSQPHCFSPLRCRHNGRDGGLNHQPHDCLLNRLFRRRSKKTSKLRVTGLCVGNSPGTGEFLAQMASNAETVSIWWRHHVNEPV